MTQPWTLFICLTLGLLSGGGAAILTAPTAWVTTGLDAPRIMQAQTCAIQDLMQRGGF